MNAKEANEYTKKAIVNRCSIIHKEIMKEISDAIEKYDFFVDYYFVEEDIYRKEVIIHIMEILKNEEYDVGFVSNDSNSSIRISWK